LGVCIKIAEEKQAAKKIKILCSARSGILLVKKKQSATCDPKEAHKPKRDEHMKTITRIVYPGVAAASLRMGSRGDWAEHSRIGWGLLLLVACAATSSAQLNDQTLAPNTAQAGIAKSLQDEI